MKTGYGKGDAVRYDDGVVGVIVEVRPDCLVVELPGGGEAYLHPLDADKLNERNATPGGEELEHGHIMVAALCPT